MVQDIFSIQGCASNCCAALYPGGCRTALGLPEDHAAPNPPARHQGGSSSLQVIAHLAHHAATECEVGLIQLRLEGQRKYVRDLRYH